MIDIEHTIKTKGKAGQLSQDSKGLLTEYTRNDDNLLKDNSLLIKNGEYAGYDETSWTQNDSSITKGKVDNYKVKNKIGLGAYGLFTKEESTTIKIPINTKGDLPSVDGITVVSEGNFINYELIGNVKPYDNIRIEFKRGLRTYDFVVSQKSGTLMKPFDMFGDFDVVCTGYKNEIQEFSEPSAPVEVNIPLGE